MENHGDLLLKSSEEAFVFISHLKKNSSILVQITAFRLLCALLLAGLAHRELHRPERTGAAVFDSVRRRTARWPGFLGRHTWRGPRQRHPALGPGASRPGGPRIRSRSDPHPLPHASVPHPGYGARPLGKPGGGGGCGRPCGQQSSLRPESGGYYEGGPQGTAELLQLLLRAKEEPVGGPDPTRHRVAQRKRFVPSHAGPGVQTASKDCGIGRRHFCWRTSVFRGHALAWALRDASRPSFGRCILVIRSKSWTNRLGFSRAKSVRDAGHCPFVVATFVLNHIVKDGTEHNDVSQPPTFS